MLVYRVKACWVPRRRPVAPSRADHCRPSDRDGAARAVPFRAPTRSERMRWPQVFPVATFGLGSAHEPTQPASTMSVTLQRDAPQNQGEAR